MKRLVIAGGGFAGFWSAMSAVRQARTLGVARKLKITLINRDAYLGIRPRYYEGDLLTARAPLENWLTPLDVELVIGEIREVQPASQVVALADGRKVRYDRLILATGSRLQPPGVPGAERFFDVDTFAGASALGRHLSSLAAMGFKNRSARTFVVLGAGFTGLEIATALPARLIDLAPSIQGLSFHLVDRRRGVGAGYESAARHHIESRLRTLDLRVHLGRDIRAYQGTRLILGNGEELASETVIAATGLRASPLTATFPGPWDEKGRLLVDDFLGLPSHSSVLVAGDASKARTDRTSWAVMSCQHAMPQGKFAGHNAVNMLFGAAPLPYAQPRYVTCLDLGPGDAMTTRGWGRQLHTVGEEAKALKTEILTEWIYPPRGIDAALAQASPEIQC